MLDSGLFRAEVSLIVGALVVLALRGLIAVCNSRGWSVSPVPIWTGLLARLAAVAVAAAVPSIGHKISSTDEAAFLATTHRLAALPLSDGKWLSLGVHWTEVIPWALTLKLFGYPGTLALRLEQIGFSLAAVVIVSATTARIGGRRAGVIAAWIAALEPSSVYFSGLLHQESLCMLGEALLLAALVDFWIRSAPAPARAAARRWQAPVAALVGLALIFGTRSYMAFFAGVAVLLVVLGLGLANRLGLTRGLLGLTAGAVVLALAGIFAAPHVVAHSLASLQHQLNVDYVGASLPLGHTDVLSSTGLLKTVVLRSLDLVLRPFPWQVASTAQKVAVAGTLLWYGLVLLTLGLAVRVGFDDALAPVVILLSCEMVGFALTLVDAGEGFRHRINLILLLTVPLGVLADEFLAVGLRHRSTEGHRRPMVELGGHGRPMVELGGRSVSGLRRGRAASPVGRGAAASALVGTLVALGFVIALPVRHQATVVVALAPGAHVSAPAGARLTPAAQLYGALGPGQAKATLAFSAQAATEQTAAADVRARVERWRTLQNPAVRARATIGGTVLTRSPRTFRDLLLGLLAGLTLGLAAGLIARRD